MAALMPEEIDDSEDILQENLDPEADSSLGEGTDEEEDD